MQVQLIDIFSKQTDFKVCKVCSHINWYENEVCSNLECSCESFDEQESSVEKAIEKEYQFWMNEERMSEEAADQIYYDL